MIAGIGVDMVDIARFENTIERTPRLLERLFTPAERALKPRSLAARYAAKEALIKALGGSDGVHWTEIEVTPEESGRPWFTLSGSTAEVVVDRGISGIHLSMSHDGGFAMAYVVAEAGGVAVAGATSRDAGAGATGAAPPDADMSATEGAAPPDAGKSATAAAPPAHRSSAPATEATA